MIVPHELTIQALRISNPSRDSSSEPLARAASRRSLRGPQKSITINNSSQQDSDDDIHMDLDSNEPKSSSGRRLFKEVAIPAKQRQSRERASYGSPTASSGSLDASANEWSNEYETPGTSVVATPAETINVRTRAAAASSKSNLLSKSNKRKRLFDEPDNQLQEDERLAKKLQEEEYSSERIEVARNQRRRISDHGDKSVVSRSDTESELLLELESAASPVARNKLTRFTSAERPAKPTAKRANPRTKSRGKQSLPKLSLSGGTDDLEPAIPGTSDLDSDFDSALFSSSGAEEDAEFMEGATSTGDPVHLVRRYRRIGRPSSYRSRVCTQTVSTGSFANLLLGSVGTC